MRIASNQFHITMSSSLQAATARVEKVLTQMAYGQRVLLPSDDPISSVRLARLDREEAALTQYRDNVSALMSRQRQSESILDSISNDMLQLKDLLLFAADGSNSSADVNAISGSLESLRDSVLAFSNTRDQEGRYLFSGTASLSPTISFDPAAAPGARYTFTGNTLQQMVVVGEGVSQPANTSLDDVAAMLNQLDLTIVDLSAPGANLSDPAVRARLVTTTDMADATFNRLGERIARLGGQQALLNNLDGAHANISLSNRQAALTLGQLDYGDATVKLEAYNTSLQATQKAYARITSFSLFDVI